MATPSFVAAGTGGVWEAGAGVTVSKTGVTVGNLVAFHVCGDGGSAVVLASHSGVEDLAGTDNALTGGVTQAIGSGANNVYLGRAILTTVSVAMSETGGSDLYARWYEFTDVNTGATLADVIENGASTHEAPAGTTTNVVPDTGVTTNGVDRLACQFVAIRDDNAMGAFTGMTGGTWAEAVAEYAEAIGTDATIQLQTATMASAGTIDGGSYTMSASDPMGVVGFALIGTTSAVVPSKGPRVIYQGAVGRKANW